MLESTISQLEALRSNLRQVVYKVEIYRDDYPTTAVDISADVEEITISIDLENRNALCRLTIKNEDYSYSPRNRNSPKNKVDGQYNPLLYPNHILKVYIGFANPTPEYWHLFTGLLGDDIDLTTIPGKISLSVRDMSKKLQDTYIYLSQSYDYQLIEDVIQGLLNEYNTGITLQLAEPTEFLIQHYQVKDSNLWDALQKLVDLMGWILMFNEMGQLILKKDKNTTVPDLIIDEDLFEVEEMNITDADIRNDIWVRAESPEGIITVNVTNPDSIAQFGRRFMEVDRSLASMVHTYDQAYNLAKKICDDLSWLHAINRIPDMPIYPPIQVDDVIAIVSSKSGLDTEELFKVYSVEHTISAERKRTSLIVKSYRFPSSISGKTPRPPTDLAAELISYQISNYPNSGWIGTKKTIYYPKVSFTRPTTNTDDTPLDNLVGYIIARSVVSSGSNFIDLRSIPAVNASGGDVTYFIDYAAGSGTRWYKMAAINSLGIRSDYSSVVSIAVPVPLIE
ncbi:MAG: hypothetical protein AB7E45_02105 [Candidatus Caldatribacteriota bacterium]